MNPISHYNFVKKYIPDPIPALLPFAGLVISHHLTNDKTVLFEVGPHKIYLANKDYHSIGLALGCGLGLMAFSYLSLFNHTALERQTSFSIPPITKTTPKWQTYLPQLPHKDQMKPFILSGVILSSATIWEQFIPGSFGFLYGGFVGAFVCVVISSAINSFFQTSQKFYNASLPIDDIKDKKTEYKIEIVNCLSGGKYEGLVHNGLAHGFGVYTHGKQRYIGQFEYGEPHGFGIKIFIGLARYEGQFYKGQERGVGVKIYDDGTQYEGEFIKNQYRAKGILTLADGRQYAGISTYVEIDSNTPVAAEDVILNYKASYSSGIELNLARLSFEKAHKISYKFHETKKLVLLKKIIPEKVGDDIIQYSILPFLIPSFGKNFKKVFFEI